MVYSIERKYHGFAGHIPDIIESIRSQEKPQNIPKILTLWMGAEFEDYLCNPAICASRFLDDGQHSEDGTFQEQIIFPDGTAIYADQVIKWTTPARGTLRHNPKFVSSIMSCGNDTDHYLKTTPFHCGRLSCPECAPYEIQYNATNHAIKLMTGAKYAKRNDRSGGYLQHLTVSAPEGLYYKFLTLDGFQEMKRYAIRIASEVGIQGGMIVFHPYRQNGVNDDDLLPDDYTPTANNDGNKHHARFAPHFHILGFGWIKPSSDDFVNSHKGWVYKAIWDEKKTISDVIATTNYLMSHTGLIAEDSPVQPSRMQSVSWIGLCNSANLQYVCEERVGEEQLCEECGCNIYVHKVKHHNEDIELQGKLYRYQKYPVYTDSAHKALMEDVYEELHGDPVALLRYIEKHPEIGVCLLSARDLDRRLTTPTPIYAKIDNSLHIPDVYAYVHVPRGILNKRRRVQRKRSFIDLDPDPDPDPDVPDNDRIVDNVPTMDILIFRTAHYPT